MKRLLPLAALALAGCTAKATPEVLTVCADPNNLPFSNRARQGFENRIADIVARDMHRPVRYVWWAQRRGYVRNTLGEQKCDLWPGVASGVEIVATTRPYYRSTYVFVTRADRNLKGLTLDDPRLKKLTIGVQMVGDDAMNTPPAHALAARGMTKNVRGFMLYGDYSMPNPPAAIVRAVADGKVDVSLVWGPLAGYFAKSSPVPLRVERVTPWLDNAQWPMVYDISMGVRKYDPVFQQQVEAILSRRKNEISAILDRYGVPRAD
jgi:mxaJ protein